MAPIRLCFFCSLPSFDTGMPISTFKLIEHFSRHPDFVVNAILPAEGELAQRIRKCGIEPWIVPFSRLRSWRRAGDFIRFLVSFPAAFLHISRLLEKNRVAIVHFSDSIDLPFYACGHLSHAAAITHLRHCIESVPGRFVFGMSARLFTDMVVCISAAVCRFAGLGESGCKVVYNPGPDAAIFRPDHSFPEVPGLPEEGDIILTIGKFIPAKGHEHFVAMARRVESLAPGRCKFVILGSDVPGHKRYFSMVRSTIAKSGIADSFIIIDRVSHELIPAILARSTIYAHLPNCQEGLGGSILEAMAMQVPVVAFDCGGVGECFTHGRAGFLVDRLNTEAAAGYVIRLLQDEPLRQRMGLAAREEAIAKFSYQKHFSEIERIYLDLIEQ